MRWPLRAMTCLSVVLFGLAGSTRAAKPIVKAPELPAPEITLRIEQRPGDYWVMAIDNTGSVPLRVVADARLLRFEITPPGVAVASPSPLKKDAKNKTKGAKKPDPNAPVLCELPTSMRSDARLLVLPPGARYLEAFDPRLYCLDRASLLVEGATLVAHLGWPTPKAGTLKPPFVVGSPPMATGSGSTFAVVQLPTIAAAKEIAATAIVVKPKSSAAAPAIALTTSVSAASASASASASAAANASASASANAWMGGGTIGSNVVVKKKGGSSGKLKPPPPPPPPPPTLFPPPMMKSTLVAHAGSARSVLAEKYTDVTFVTRNEGAEPVTIYARPQLIAALVRGPRGDRTMCEGFIPPPAPIVDFVTRLAPGASWSTTVGLPSICPAGTFDYPGLYEVTPLLHAQPIPEIPKAIAGDLYADKPQLVRVEEGKKPFHDLPPFALLTSE